MFFLEYYISKIIKKLHLRAVKNSRVHKSSSIGSGSLFIDSTMGRNSFCGYDCVVVKTIVGSFCSIASNCEIGGATHSIEWVSTSPVFNENKEQIKKKYSHFEFGTNEMTIIGHDVWIGSRALIKSGVNIGTGAVIGMGSVVTKDVPPFEIWAGNPAKLIRKRFDDEMIEVLLESEWWEMKDQELEKMAVNIRNVKDFIDLISMEKERKLHE